MYLPSKEYTTPVLVKFGFLWTIVLNAKQETGTSDCLCSLLEVLVCFMSYKITGVLQLVVSHRTCPKGATSSVQQRHKNNYTTVCRCCVYDERASRIS